MAGDKSGGSKHRRAELDKALCKRDVVTMLQMISAGERDGNDAPRPPDPDSDCGLRQWKLCMQAWKNAVKTFIE